LAHLIDTLLLLALPASGKSEVRTFLASHRDEDCQSAFHLGPTVQLDDYPYVHLMRRIDDEAEGLGLVRPFFHAGDRPFKDGRDWLTLVELLNQDYAALHRPAYALPPNAAEHLVGRIEAAAAKHGIPPRIGILPQADRIRLFSLLEPECRGAISDLIAAIPASLEGRTIVIEFARGGPDGSSMPLPDPLGYRASLARLSPDLLEHASILYIWVTPQDSRRKNVERTDPNDPGSILNHGVPIEVMMKDYGCDDMDWLIRQSEHPGTVTVEAHGRTFLVPVARFDNRDDLTTFVRGARDRWQDAQATQLRDGLRDALAVLVENS
jgi:hypothetical protein